MKHSVLGIVITHGNLACSLSEVSEKLVANQQHLHCFSTQMLSSEKIIREIEQEIQQAKPDKIFIFVDLMGSNCWIIANKIKHQFAEKTVIISGVNVPMLISYLINSTRMEWQALLEKIIADAKKGIVSR